MTEERASLFADAHYDTGKPHKRVVERINGHDLSVCSDHFPSPALKAYYFANAVEAASCWPRVVAGTMEQARFHDRTQRMMNAILRVTKSVAA